MEVMNAVLAFLENHQGACMVVLTLMLAFFAAVSCIIAANSVRLMGKLEAKRSRPYVLLETTNSVPFFGVKISNMGLTAARRVTVETKPRLQTVFSTYRRPVGFLDRQFSILVPQKSYSTDLGDWDELKRENPSMIYQCTIRYESEWGDKYVSDCVLDYSIYENLANKREGTVSDLVQKFDEFTRAFGHLTTGGHKLHVLTEDYHAHQKQENKERKKIARLLEKKQKQLAAMKAEGHEGDA